MGDLGTLPLPTEILVEILKVASDLSRRRLSTPHERSTSLATFALVSRQFQRSAYSVLYGDLRVPWQAGTVLRLLRSLRANPSLGRVTRSLSALAIDAHEWQDDWARMTTDKIGGDAGGVAPWDEPDDLEGLERPEDIFREMEHTEHTTDIEDWHEASEQAMSVASARAWERAGHERWRKWSRDVNGWMGDPWVQQILDIEDLLELALYLSNLKTLKLGSFRHDQLLRNPLDDPRFVAARELFSNLSSLVLVDVSGLFGGSLVRMIIDPIVMSLTNTKLWEEGMLPVKASPKKLNLCGRLDYWPWFSTMMDPLILQHLSFDLTSSSSLNGWLPLLHNLTSLSSLHIRLARLRYSSTWKRSLPANHAPYQVEQASFGAYLSTTPIRTLSLDWWPTRTLISSLPLDLVTLKLGPRYPYDDSEAPFLRPEQHAPEPEREKDLERLDRAELAGMLRKLPNLRVVALPSSRVPPSNRGMHRVRMMTEEIQAAEARVHAEEFLERKLELEELGYAVRERLF
ncbi:hypothetical protein P7C70_g2287, partial [Phenoliferia sp. Uapishka_3]